MIVHFICRGNTYRSRLAETYLNSKQLPNLKAVSSGIEADKDLSGPITWYAQRIIQKEGLQEFSKPMWQKTTKELLGNSDLNIFMNKDIYDFCVSDLGFAKNNFEVWDIADANEIQPDWKNATEEGKIKITEETFSKIRQKVEELIVRLEAEKVV